MACLRMLSILTSLKGHSGTTSEAIFDMPLLKISVVVYSEAQVDKMRICLWTKIDWCCVASSYASKWVLGRIDGFLHTEAIDATMETLRGVGSASPL